MTVGASLQPSRSELPTGPASCTKGWHSCDIIVATRSSDMTDSESQELTHRRVVVKAGTGILTGGTGHLDRDAMSALVRQIAALHAAGGEPILLTSGAMATGRHILGVSRSRSRDIPFRQVPCGLFRVRIENIVFVKHPPGLALGPRQLPDA